MQSFLFSGGSQWSVVTSETPREAFGMQQPILQDQESLECHRKGHPIPTGLNNLSTTEVCYEFHFSF